MAAGACDGLPVEALEPLLGIAEESGGGGGSVGLGAGGVLLDLALRCARGAHASAPARILARARSHAYPMRAHSHPPHGRPGCMCVLV